MVKWQGRRQSRNIEDRRGAAAGGGGALIVLVRFILGRFGVRGLIVVLALGAGLYLAGVNPLTLMEGGGERPAQQAGNDQAARFVGAVLGETEDVWARLFQQNGARYREPTLVMFSQSVSSACGFASAAAGPFYCPADQKVYLDTSFFSELSERFGAPGDFAAAYVIAHEVGHHVQTVLGVSAEVRNAQKQARTEAQANEVQVRMELQADCFAGIWANHADRMSNFLDDGDIEEGLRAAAAIGDDTLQRNAGRRVTPESFTHGSSAQRQRWFTAGYRSGDIGACDTFSAASL